MSKLVDILIGDCEGNHMKHSFYLNLEDDEYKIGFGGIIMLSDKGLDKYKSMWDTRYYNYWISEISPEKRDELIVQMKRDLNTLVKSRINDGLE